ncbi:MAG: hypothetical protein JOY54_09020 [Acidobacteriaceae bacterium]|nr:hypothetical protein [Acidobacteriaceae bacterium]
MSAPILGLTTDASGNSVRAIEGTPAAALFSDPLSLPPGVTHVFLAPRQHYALAEQGEQTSLAILPFSGKASGPLLTIPNAMPHADQVAFSPEGKAAVLYSQSNDRLQVIGGLPDSAQILFELKPLMLPDGLLRLAISDDGSRVFAVSQKGTIYSLVRQEAPLESASDAAGVAFLPGSTDAVYCVRSTGAMVGLSSDGSATSPAFAQVSGLGKQVYLEALSDGAGILVADSEGKRVIAVSQSGATESLSLPAHPTALIPLQSPHLFLLSAQPGKPGLVLEMSTGHLRFFYIPQLAVPEGK